MLKNTLCSIILVLSSLVVYAQNEEYKNATPNWVKPIEIPENDDTVAEGGTRYLLYENQVNFNEEESYFRHAVVLNSSESLVDYSSLSFDYDPSYQTFTFHKIGVVRDGEYLDKLSNQIVNTYHRETSMERSIYDGSLTAVINLADVRKGDMLVYSYSFKGRNKAFPNHVYDYQNLEFNSPVSRLYYRVYGKKKDLKYELHNGASDPTRVFHGSDIELIWNKTEVTAKQYFSNTPSWYNNAKHVTISNYGSWNEVLEQVLPFYSISADEKAFLKTIIPNFSADDEESRVLKAIQFVQDEIRYLGFEEGIHAFKPHSVKEIYNQRFGDCKDKSYLLAGILSSMGYEANPILVHTRTRKALKDAPISPYSFDHCVVKFRYHERDIYIDPTWNEQGGDLLSYTFPNYYYCLVLSDGSTGLDSIYNRYQSATYIIDEFTVPKDNEESGTLVVKTEYRGASADDIRVYFGNNTQEEIKKDYLNYYNTIYSGIDVVGDVMVEDDRDGNIIKTTETYSIDSMWVTEDERSVIEFYSLQLRSLVKYSREAGRDVPHYITPNKSFRHLINIKLPESWSVEESEEHIERENYSYDYSASYNEASHIISLSHRYSTSGDFIPVENYNEFLADHDLMNNQVYFQVYKGVESQSTEAGFPYYMALITIILVFVFGLGISTFFATKVSKRYDPKPANWAKGDKKIGGWLVLPAIGLVITPFVLLHSMYSEMEIYNPELWVGLLSPSSGYYRPVGVLLIALEIVINCSLLVYTVLCCFMFYQKRSSAPNLISGLYLAFLILITTYSLLISWYTENSLSNLDIKDILKQLMAAIIWIPYFQLSDRVKETFNRQLRPQSVVVEENLHHEPLEV